MKDTIRDQALTGLVDFILNFKMTKSMRKTRKTAPLIHVRIISTLTNVRKRKIASTTWRM